MRAPTRCASPTFLPRLSRAVAVVAVAAGFALLAGCAQTPPPAPALTDLLAQPAENALMQGLRAYDDAQYPLAERQFRLALRTGLASPRDQASAYKHLAFIFCTSDRVDACEQAFVAARRVDPAFTLSRSEEGHPIWGPVYRRVLP